MRLAIPGLYFAISSIPLEFHTDGSIIRIEPVRQSAVDAGQILVVMEPHIQGFNLISMTAVSLFSAMDLPRHFRAPELYTGSQDLAGKNILIMMLNGWGDLILIQPALRAFYRKAASGGKPPRMTIACNWIRNFPYPEAAFIHQVRPNIMTLKDLCRFDVLVNLAPANYQRSPRLSMRDAYRQIMKIDADECLPDTPVLEPDPHRVEKIRRTLDDIRGKTGRKLLAVNWRSRFPHKNAPASLFAELTERLSPGYQAILFKDGKDASAMQAEIEAWRMPVMNLSPLIGDYHDTIAALSLVDAFISVDTGIVHAAGALGIPGVALFGPFPPETHVADYPSVAGIRAGYEGNTCRAPCLETHRGCVEANYASGVVSPCFQAFHADQVLRALAEITNRRDAIRPGRDGSKNFFLRDADHASASRL